ncbi:hypothetical protein C8A00DRAFT_35768 [Chaetomidium leptoderma]|uniref:Uncharacterized protein n=1 Tax=Chaetomidium leptoderma TaxID=669021 RepID=A0AAN6VHV4_9PEZI|nr:hypothetical protein C8A00DRAFT_35768 [Chaetomidium leptoderma]
MPAGKPTLVAPSSDAQLRALRRRLKLKRIKDVKHHVLKRHRHPLYCLICGRTDFANAAARDGHVRARECVAPPGGFIIQGLDLDQVTQLERRANRKLNITEQWMGF